LRVVRYDALEPGLRLIVLGAVHGNETCGTQAMWRMMAEFDAGLRRLARGCVSFVPVANPLAFLHRRREGERNLNRRLGPVEVVRCYEDALANWLCPLLAGHDALLDLHSFRSGQAPFVMLGPENNAGPIQPFARAGQEEHWVRALGVRRVVDGWLSTYARGTAARRARGASTGDLDARLGIGTTEYMRSTGGFALTLECGQHDDPAAVEVAYRAIECSLIVHGLIDAPLPVPLPAAQIEALRLVEVFDRLDEADCFTAPWSNFDRCAAGQCLAVRADGQKIIAQEEGWIVFPDAAARAGDDWFYLAYRNPRAVFASAGGAEAA
jgi:predicted deacylase